MNRGKIDSEARLQGILIASEITMTFEVAPLPYDYSALEPYIDAQTMQLHHDKHHQAYVDNLNKAVAGDASLQGRSLEEIVANVASAPQVVRNNGGGHWNHSFFWEIMGPAGGQPSGELADAITSKFGSFEALQEQFNTAGLGRFGSGWVWLIAVPGQGLEVVSTPNQDNPLMDVAEKKGTPILGNDVWEHAYYLNYQNRRADYLKAWWNVVNWDKVQQRFAAI
jgi:Fe-Mn family superoxide dismutase